MLKLIAFGLATGAGIQAWRNFPPDGPVTSRSLAFVFILGVVLAYAGGRWRGRHSASAFAAARAEANSTAVSGSQAHVNVAVFAPGGMTAGESVGATRIPTAAAPWLGSERSTVSIDDLDGMDASDLNFEQSSSEHVT